MSILSYTDLKNNEDKIVIDVLNSFYKQNQFMRALHYFSKGTGYGSEYSGFTFWNDLDDYDKSFYEEEFNGVELNFLEQEKIIKFKDLYNLIELSSKNYEKEFPNNKVEIFQLLSRIKKTFKLN